MVCFLVDSLLVGCFVVCGWAVLVLVLVFRGVLGVEGPGLVICL